MRLRLMGRALLAGTAVILALAGCGGSDTSDTSANAKGLEKTTLKVGILAVPDAAPLQVAIDHGFFKEEGLDVKISVEAGGATATPKLIAGSLDAMLSNYVSLFSAQYKGTGSFKIVADSYQAAPDNFVIQVLPDSPIKTPADLKDKKIAVNTLNNIGTLSVTATLKIAGVEAKPEQFVPMALPDMGPALKNGTVDAIWVAEPFISANAKELGARKVADTMSGPMADFPIAGWAVTEKFAQENPNTVAAFQRALGKAQQLAATNRKVVEQALPKYTKIDARTAAVITLGEFPTSLNEARLQRVADVMTEFGYLPGKLDVKPLILPPPAG